MSDIDPHPLPVAPDVQKVLEVDKVVTRHDERQKRGLQFVIAVGVIISALGTTIISPYFAFRTAEVTARKVEQVKSTLYETNTVADGKLDKIHGLVNSAMKVQLHLNMVTTARLAATTNDKADIQAAKEAKQAYDEHVEAQVKIDAENAKGTPAR